MRAEPTDKERKLYDENGFVVIEEFLDAFELAHWRQEVDDAVEARVRGASLTTPTMPTASPVTSSHLRNRRTMTGCSPSG